MSKDVEQLFRNINQAGLPYQVFEPPSVPSPAIGHAEPEPMVRGELTTWTGEAGPAPARSKVFRNYLAEAQAQPAVTGTLLKPIFDRMREKRDAIEARRAKPSA